MKIPSLINTDPEILSGQPVFSGTRVPVESLFMHLKDGISLDDFPSVTREQAIAVLELAEKLLMAKTAL